jgi:hypothetical protein
MQKYMTSWDSKVTWLLVEQSDINSLQELGSFSSPPGPDRLWDNPGSHQMNICRSKVKAAGEWSFPFTSNYNVRRFAPPSPMHLHGVVLRYGDDIAFTLENNKHVLWNFLWAHLNRRQPRVWTASATSSIRTERLRTAEGTHFEFRPASKISWGLRNLPRPFQTSDGTC